MARQILHDMGRAEAAGNNGAGGLATDTLAGDFPEEIGGEESDGTRFPDLGWPVALPGPAEGPFPAFPVGKVLWRNLPPALLAGGLWLACWSDARAPLTCGWPGPTSGVTKKPGFSEETGFLDSRVQFARRRYPAARKTAARSSSKPGSKRVR